MQKFVTMSKARGGNEAGVVEQERAWPIKADEEESCEGRGGKEREDDAQRRGGRTKQVGPRRTRIRLVGNNTLR